MPRIQVVCSEEEYAAIKARAGLVPLSKWLKSVALAEENGGPVLPAEQVREVKRKLEEFQKPVEAVEAKKVTTIPSRHRPPEKERKAKKQKDSGTCQHGFMIVDGTTACPRCAE